MNKNTTREYIQRIYIKRNFTPGPIQDTGIEERLQAFEKYLWQHFKSHRPQPEPKLSNYQEQVLYTIKYNGDVIFTTCNKHLGTNIIKQKKTSIWLYKNNSNNAR